MEGERERERTHLHKDSESGSSVDVGDYCLIFVAKYRVVAIDDKIFFKRQNDAQRECALHDHYLHEDFLNKWYTKQDIKKGERSL